MIILFSDFGSEGPYLGQVEAVLYREAAGHDVIRLLCNAPVHAPKLSAYLLASYLDYFPEGSVFLCVVDPAVGSEERRPVVVQADGRWFVGPANGLFNVIARRAKTLACWEINWKPEVLSATFHGRDLFAPVAAILACGEKAPVNEKDVSELLQCEWPDDLNRIIYIDHFGNAVTGVRAISVKKDACLEINGQAFHKAVTYNDVLPGTSFWYENANGLIEIAVNQGRANEQYGINIGDELLWG